MEFCGFHFPHPMPREEKKIVELRPVDDQVVREPVVVRLHAPGRDHDEEEVQPVKLGKTSPQEEAAPARLDLPEREEIEVRSHQPGIEALIEDVAVTTETPEQSWGAEVKPHHPLPWGWFALIGVGIVAAVAWSLTRVKESQEQAVEIRERTEMELQRDFEEEAEAAALVARIEETIGRFFTVSSVNSYERLVRHPERVMPLIRDHHSRHPGFPARLRSVRAMQPLTLDDRGNFWMASVMLADRKLRSLLLEIGEDGTPRIDWETFVCYQPMAWDDFATKRPDSTALDFRVYVEPDTFYSHEFADSNKWVSFRLTALDADETLFGYMAADHPDLPEIMRCVRLNQGRKTSLILRLNIPRGLQSRRGVVIEKLQCPRWLYLDSPSSGA